MKTLLTFILIFVATAANAQNKLRRHFTETYNGDAVIITAPTPAMLNLGYYMQFSLHKIFLPINTVQYVLQAGNPSYNGYGGGYVTIRIIFRDQEMVTLEALYRAEYIATIYADQNKYIPTVVLPDAVMDKLKTKKISYFRVDGDRAWNLTAASFSSRIKRYPNYLSDNVL
jgi:hypothetical protein